VLVGGVALLRGLPEFLEEETGVTFHLPEAPERATVRGLDLLLQDPDIRRGLITNDNKRVLGRRTSRLGEKLAGLAAVALIFVAAYFPAEAYQGRELIDKAKSYLLPALARISTPASGETGTLQQKEAKWAETERRLRALQEQNKRLEKVANVQSQPPGWAPQDIPVGQVILRRPDSWNEELVIDLGRVHGVKNGAVATTADGLLGRVSETKEQSAHVKLTTATDQEFGAKVQRTGSPGVLEPESKDMFKLTYLNPDDGIKVGDLVTTSSLDGVYPGGIPIGTVSKLYRSGDQSYLTAEVKPSVNPDNVSEVLLLTQGGNKV
jgi:rod shape-determining protein MreC